MDDMRQRLRNPVVHEGEARKAARKICQWRAMLRFGVMEVGCIVEDIGIGGCRVQLFSGKIRVGTSLSVCVPVHDKVFRGKVVWKRGDEAGISFI